MDVTDLIETEEIKRLKYRYLRCLDQKRWDEIGDCFTDDATTSYGDGQYAFTGRDQIVAFLRESMGRDDFASSHRCTHPEIDLTSETTATGTWALNDDVIIGEHDLELHGAAFYRDEYRKVDGQWKIAHTGYQRTFEQFSPHPSG
jgi:bile-acid 7alpha-dehydratase